MKHLIHGLLSSKLIFYSNIYCFIKVCVTRLHDVQLALVISRLFENSMNETHQRILETYVLGYKDEPHDEGW